MNCTRNHFFTSAVFTNNQDCSAGIRHCSCVLQNFLQRLTGPYQPSETTRAEQFISKACVLELQTAHARGLVHNMKNFRSVNRLFKESVSAAPDRLERSAF